MKKSTQMYLLLLLLVFFTSCEGQNKADPPPDKLKPETTAVITANGPTSITRNIIQDRKGNLWIAAFDGVFQYDGKSFTNIISEVSSARFFSLLEDQKGNLWFGSIGAGVYQYDGKSFQQFTSEEGLLNSEILCMYEDKAGNLWFGVNGGLSRYDGKSFRNYLMEGDSIMEDQTGKTIPALQRPSNEVNAIVEDKTGKFWMGTRGNAFVYDGNTFATVIHNGTPFTNVRTIIEDKAGNIWLGGNDGLWRYDGSTFTNFTPDFVGYIHEDQTGNIWTSSETAQGWALSRYEETSLSHKKPTVTEIRSEYEGNRGMIFGILEADDGSIWYGGLDGVHRYDGNTLTNYTGKESQK